MKFQHHAPLYILFYQVVSISTLNEIMYLCLAQDIAAAGINLSATVLENVLQSTMPVTASHSVLMEVMKHWNWTVQI
jgi:hypothetical protein